MRVLIAHLDIILTEQDSHVAEILGAVDTSPPDWMSYKEYVLSTFGDVL
jgi:acetone carboxylase gamma subunit